MRELIIGKKGIGKTTLIKNELIPVLKEYIIFDIFQEYMEFKNVISFSYIGESSSRKSLKEKFQNVAAKTDSNTVIILDNTECYLYPEIDAAGKESYEWIKVALKEKQFILTTTYIRTHGIYADLDLTKIYLFDTTNSEQECSNFKHSKKDIIKLCSKKLTQR